MTYSVKLSVQVLISASVLAIIIILNETYQDNQFEKSLVNIPKLQDGANLEFWNVYSDSSYWVMGAVWFFSVATVNQKWRLIYYLGAPMSAEFCSSFFKQCYYEARPYWENPAIDGQGCSYSMGHPSGHTTLATSLYIAIALDITVSVYETQMTKCQKLSISITSILVAIALSGLMGFTRVIQGVHAQDQVILGFQLGLWVACNFGLILRPRIKYFTDKMITDHQLIEEKFGKYLSILIGFWLLFLAMDLQVYLISYHVNSPEPEWLTAIEACKAGMNTQKFFINSNFFTCSCIGFVFGAPVGMVLEARFFKTRAAVVQEMYVLRWLIRSAISFTYLWLTFQLAEHELNLFDEQSNFYLAWIFYSVLPCFFTTMIPMFLFDWVYIKVKLLEQAENVDQATNKISETPGEEDNNFHQMN